MGSNLYQNEDANGIKQIVFCIRVPQVKGKPRLTLFYLVVSRTWLVLFDPVVEIRVVFDSLCGWTGTTILSLGLTEPHRAQFISTRVAERSRSELLDHHLELTWQDGMKER